LQVEPPEQTVPQVPQFPLSVWRFAQAPPEQAVVPLAQLDEQALLLHTCVLLQVVPQAPQLVLFDDTQLPPQLRRPVPQAQTPAEQVCPVPQTFPHAPQFCASVCTFVQPCEQAFCPLAQVTPVVPPFPVPLVPPLPVSPPPLGLAQPPTNRAAPRIAASAAGKEIRRANMFDS